MQIKCRDTGECCYSYREYLNSCHWRNFTDRLFADGKNKCQSCGSIKKLNFHHLNYKHIGDELDSEVVCLCDVCHKIEHGFIRKPKTGKNKQARKFDRYKTKETMLLQEQAQLRREQLRNWTYERHKRLMDLNQVYPN
jgi:hypothetical protein